MIAMGLECPGEVVILSADRKAVVPCGTVAVSGHLKVPSYNEKLDHYQTTLGFPTMCSSLLP